MAEYLVGASRLMPQGGGSAEQQLAELRDFCRVLLDELSWALSNMSAANFSERALEGLAERIGGGTGGGLQMAAGQYTGNGNMGAEYAVSLSFPFAPRLVVIQCRPASTATQAKGPLLIHAGVTKVHNRDDGSGDNLYVTWSGDGKSVSWYSETSGSWQMNINNTVYNWTAIG